MMRIAYAATLAAVLLVSHVFAPRASAALIGDVNNSCRVDVMDIYITSLRYGARWGMLAYSPIYDLDGNRRIDIIDLQIIASHAGEEC
jgi:hypothetical protein